MHLSPGTSLGSYKILAPLGAGGMGEVYKAQHLRLGREVAVKVLPDSLANAPDRRSRFEREARVLASLNHPNIATLHGIEECGDRTVIEMELVPGETLDDCLKRQPLSTQDAVRIFKQIASALEAAHEQGVIHRDLKPANIKITPDGRVKVLDFGLAKALAPEAVPESPQSPTFTTITHEGVIFGTAAYMSPEQLRGRPVDRRSDIWSFGCMLYQAVTGKIPFAAETISDTLAAVLREEPDWSAFPGSPLSLQRLARRCLRKDPQDRLHDIGDARLELEDALNESAAVVWALPGTGSWRVSRRRAIAAGAAVLLAVALATAAGWAWGRSARPAQVHARFAVSLPPGFAFDQGPGPVVAVSPDGSRLVFVAVERGGGTQLFVHSFDQFEPAALPGTRGASAPFFSPDGRWIAFYGNGALQKVSSEGGAPLKISDAPPVWSATWGEDQQIYFATAIAPHGLRRVHSDGGATEELTVPKSEDGELQHAFPQLLPGGTRALFSILTKNGWDPAVLSLDTRQWTTVMRGASAQTPAYVAGSSHLVYAQQGGGLVALPFDTAAGKQAGGAFPLLERIDVAQSGGSGLALAASGTLAYIPARSELPQRILTVVDRQGVTTPISDARGAYSHPRVAADGSKVAVAIESETGTDIWVHDLQRGTRTRVTGGGSNRFPIWNGRGTQLAFQAAASPGRFSLFSRDAGGGAEPVPLLGAASDSAALQAGTAGLLPGSMPRPGSANPHVPVSWSADGRHLAFAERKPGAQRDIWVLSLDGETSPFVLTPFDEWSPAFSPNGEWLAYVSNESGRNEVYVQPYPGPGGKWLISTDGGTEPAWSHDGKELFYRRDGQMFAVTVQTTPTFSVSRPRLLFDGPFETTDASRNYDVLPDGRFLMVRGALVDVPQRLYVALDWLDQLRARETSGR